MKYNDDKRMSLRKKINLYKKMKEELVEKSTQLADISSEISSKKEELDYLKKESLELKDFINGKINSEFYENCNSSINMKDCYVISLDGKKYISLKRSNYGVGGYSHMDGVIWAYKHEYFDALLRNDNGEFRYLCGYGFHSGTMPEFEEHILKLYPELKVYCDGYVPVAHLRKIYYEINDSSKSIPSSEENVSKVKKLN